MLSATPAVCGYDVMSSKEKHQRGQGHFNYIETTPGGHKTTQLRPEHLLLPDLSCKVRNQESLWQSWVEVSSRVPGRHGRPSTLSFYSSLPCYIALLYC